MFGLGPAARAARWAAVNTVKTVTGTASMAMHAPLAVKAGALTAGLVGAAAAGRALAPAEYAGEDHATPDGMGSYEAESGVRQRMASMRATGNLVFGLHNGRR